MRRLGGLAAAALAAGGLALAGCGGTSSQLEVSAASSLRTALTHYSEDFGRVAFSFAGSDQLAAQIRAGARPDVFAAANSKIPQALYASHLLEQPVPFATNTLVLAVPAHGSKLASLADAARPGVKIAAGSATVPVGAYTLEVLAALGPLGATLRADIRSQEPDDASIVGQLESGAVDAGFVYATDVRASKGALRSLSIPARAKPTVVYEVAVVAGGPHAARARSFIAGLLHGAGRAALLAAGFGAPGG